MKFGSLPADIESNPRSRTGLAELGLSPRTERGLREAGFTTAGQVASRSAEELKALLYFTPKMITEVEGALARLGLSLRAG
jgi:DNA-directed RNA polymerase alpha subunit